ncbi:MAG: hypothetical protein U0X75_26535 [Acidobacteriota bacterium]
MPLGLMTLPNKVFSMGGHHVLDDDQVTPNTQIANLEFNVNGKKKIIVFEVRHWISNHEAGIGEGGDSNTIGNIFYGSVAGGRSRLQLPQDVFGPEQEPGRHDAKASSNWENFIKAVRSCKREDLNGEIEAKGICPAR